MKKATLFALLIVATTLGLKAPSARAQGTLDPNLNNPAQEKAADKELNRRLDPGKSCLDYTVDVISLFDNDHRMYWRRTDCIRIYVTNNPFLYKYSLSIDATPIHEDDPLGSLGTLIGVNVSSANGTGTNSDTTKSDATNKGTAEAPSPQGTPEAAISPGTLDQMKADNAKLTAALSSTDAKAKMPHVFALQQSLSTIVKRGTYAAVETERQKLESNKTLDKAPNESKEAKPVVQNLRSVKTPPSKPSPVPPIEHWNQDIENLKRQSTSIRETYDLVHQEYRRFSTELPDKLKRLIDDHAPREAVEAYAEAIRVEATQELNCLSDGIRNDASTLHNCPGANNAVPTDPRTLERQMVEFAHRAAALHVAIQEWLTKEDSEQTRQIGAISDELHRAGGDVAYTACAFKGTRDNDLSTLQTRLIDPLSTVITDGFSWGYKAPDAAYSRLGPYGDPTGVTLTLKRTRVFPFATSPDGATIKNTSSSFECSSDTTDMFEHGADYQGLSDFFTDKPVQGGKANTYTRNQNKPKVTGSSVSQEAVSSAKKKTTDQVEEQPLVQPWFFGRPRLVVSGGITQGFLAQKDYQRSTAPDGTAIVGLKTDSKYRLTPMLYGHVLLPRYARHQGDAFYGTLGVTAKSDSKGVDPEFLLGFSRSFAQQRFFFTTGAYIGQKQRLDGGLQLGKPIPTSLTGELPVTKGYRVGWAFGISFRFASTKDPQKEAGTAQTIKSSKKN